MKNSEYERMFVVNDVMMADIIKYTAQQVNSGGIPLHIIIQVAQNINVTDWTDWSFALFREECERLYHLQYGSPYDATYNT